jgi:ribulose-5-phosphate 4-epimerase/fuculose-1-phosphate aldolase
MVLVRKAIRPNHTRFLCLLQGSFVVLRLHCVILDIEEGKRISSPLGQHKAVILRNHGLLTVGRTVDEAAWWFITMERSCQAQLMAEAAGTPVLIDPEDAEVVSGQVGTELAGWFSFQPLWDRIVKEQPDLLD